MSTLAGRDSTISDGERTNPFEVVKGILLRGHTIHGFSSGDDLRVLKVLEDRVYRDRAPLFGYGVDGTAERALGRALITYAIRKQNDWDYITANQIPESLQDALPPVVNNSQFDNIVWGGDFWLYREVDDVVAGSTYGGTEPHKPLEVHGSTALEAIGKLANTYDFVSSRVRTLPVLSVEYIPDR